MLYKNIGVNFLLQAKPETIYYGRYVTEINDSYINRGFEIEKAVS